MQQYSIAKSINFIAAILRNYCYCKILLFLPRVLEKFSQQHDPLTEMTYPDDVPNLNNIQNTLQSTMEEELGQKEEDLFIPRLNMIVSLNGLDICAFRESSLYRTRRKRKLH